MEGGVGNQGVKVGGVGIRGEKFGGRKYQECGGEGGVGIPG